MKRLTKQASGDANPQAYVTGFAETANSLVRYLWRSVPYAGRADEQDGGGWRPS
jgi:hypothetical protein